MLDTKPAGWRLACAGLVLVAGACSDDGGQTASDARGAGAGGKAAASGGAPAARGGNSNAGVAARGGATADGGGGAGARAPGGAPGDTNGGTGPRSSGSGGTGAVEQTENGGEAGDAGEAGYAGSDGGAANGGVAGNGVANGGVANGATGHGGAANGGSASGGVAGGGVAGDGASGTLSLSNFLIEPNPNMTVSCFVSWTTDTPASSEVDFGEDTYSFRIRDAALVSEHRVLVIGMHADTAYQLRAVSSNDASSGSAEGTFSTGALPAGIPIPALTASDFGRSQLGWTLMNIEVGRSTPAKIVMYDQQGVPVWYFIDGTHDDTRGDVSTALYGNSVLVGPAPGEPAREVDLSGAVLWEGPANDDLSHEQTHGASKTSSGHYLLNIELDKAAQSGTTKIDNQLLEELTPDLGVVWSWQLFDHVAPAGNREELCHGNSLKLDEAANIAYYNCRYLGLFKLDRVTGNILWRLGGSYDQTSLGPGDFSYVPPSAQFSNTHEPELHADGTLLVYDNGAVNATPPTGQSYHSRVVEYALDQTALTATRTFEFPGDFAVDDWYKNDWYTQIWGDADRLANGDVLVTAGMRSKTLSTRVFEVTRSGEVVWEMTFPPNNGSFQADRLSPPPLVESLE